MALRTERRTSPGRDITTVVPHHAVPSAQFCKFRVSQNALSPLEQRAPRPRLILVFIFGLANTKQLLSPIPNVCQRDARSPRPHLALQVVILREQRGRRRIGFVVKPEQSCAGLIFLVRLETERQVEG